MPAPLSPALDFNPTKSHQEILRLVVEYRYLTPRLLSLAYGLVDWDQWHRQGKISETQRKAWKRSTSRAGRGLKHIRHELRRLHLAGYVTRFNPNRQLVGFANQELVYAATIKGARAVLDDAEYSKRRHQIFTRSRREQTNYQHHLGVSALQLILSLGASSQGFELAQFAGERDSDAVRIPSVRLDGQSGSIYPDATAVFRFPKTDQRTLYLFEYDLAKKNDERLGRRFQAYQNYLTNRLDEVKRTYSVNNAVAVFIAPSSGDVAALLRLAQHALDRTSRRSRALLLFWNAEDWWDTIELRRRQNRDDHKERRWVIRTLRPPAEILADDSLGSLDVPARRLVQS